MGKSILIQNRGLFLTSRLTDKGAVMWFGGPGVTWAENAVAGMHKQLRA